jgi:hypothetical protein
MEVTPHLFSFDDTYTAFIDLKNTGYKVLTEWVGPGVGLLVSPVSPKSIEENIAYRLPS